MRICTIAAVSVVLAFSALLAVGEDTQTLVPAITFNKTGDPVYKIGEKAIFRIVMPKISDADPTYNVRLRDARGKELFKEDFKLADKPEIEVQGSLDKPGFLICEVRLKRGARHAFNPLVASAAFEPEKISPGAECPADFVDFWNKARARLDKEVAPDYKVKKLKEDAFNNYYEVTAANFGGTLTYAYTTIPKKNGKYPAVVRVPPAGPGIWQPEGARDVIRMTVNVFDRRMDGTLYKEFNQPTYYFYMGAPDRERYYYYKSILGVARMLDYLTSLPEWDGTHLVMNGRSQGGGFALIMAGLYPKVTAAAADVPALCDHRGEWPGWPQLVKNVKGAEEMSGYFDVANFCRQIKCPVMVSAGFIDSMCTPNSIYAAFNLIKSEKKIYNGPFTGHGWGETMKTFEADRDRWIEEKTLGKHNAGTAQPSP